MPADIALDPGISAIAAFPAKPENAGLVPSAAAQGAAYAPPASLAAAAPKLANPQLTVDPSTARVVYEYFNQTGVLTNSIPSPQQLQAYRLAARSGEGQDSAAVQTTPSNR